MLVADEALDIQMFEKSGAIMWRGATFPGSCTNPSGRVSSRSLFTGKRLVSAGEADRPIWSVVCVFAGAERANGRPISLATGKTGRGYSDKAGRIRRTDRLSALIKISATTYSPALKQYHRLSRA